MLKYVAPIVTNIGGGMLWELQAFSIRNARLHPEPHRGCCRGRAGALSTVIP